MALVSSSVPIHIRHPQMERRLSMRGFNRSASVRSAGSSGSSSLVEIEEEPIETVVEEEEQIEKVYVAVGKEYKDGRETLIWVLQNTSREKKIVIVHVHRPAQMIPMMGAKFSASQLQEQQVRAYRQLERQKMNKSLDEYLALCSHAKVRAEKLVIEMDDVGKGLVELIAQHGITKLVMGAAADRQYSKKMKVPKSKTAISVQQEADRSCQIRFVCKGNLICTRESDPVDGSGIPSSPTASLSSRSRQSEQLRSRSLPQHQTEALSSIANLTHRSRSVSFDSHGGGITTESPLDEMPIKTSTTASNFSTAGSTVSDPCSWEGISRSSQASTSSVSEEVLSNMGRLPMSKDDENKNGSVLLPSTHESEDELQFSTPSLELEDGGMDNEVYEKLQQALREAEDSKREAFTESCRRQKAERDAIEASRKAKASENLYTKEQKQRKNIEVTLEREKLELEKLKTQRNKVIEELQKANEQKLVLELQFADSEQIIKDLEEKLSAAKCLLSSLQRDHEELKRELENAVREGEEQRRKKEEATTSTQGVMNFSEFTYPELERATGNFDDSLKIGEGGYGSVYKGILRHTMVAIKMLNSQSMQGQAEFYQEVEVLSRVRHPHLITLIGTCPEAWALIYEYLPQGSLEDRLTCKNNTPPLPWQARTRIAAEICSALIFLHSNKAHTVVHGDLKPGNILLDSNFVSKLGDFGICRLLVQSNTTTTPYWRTHPKGTFAYMDPEFVSSGELTPGSDVYSFGVIILRLLTGRPAVGIIKEVREAMEGGRLHEILDVLAGDWPFVQAKQLAHLALRCCEIKRKNRPELAGEAWRVLKPMMKAASSMGWSALSFRSAAGNSCIPSYFFCPIFQEIMRDPHIAADGFTYEAEALKGWLDSGHDTSPMTNRKLSHRDVIPNLALRSAIQEWLQKQN